MHAGEVFVIVYKAQNKINGKIYIGITKRSLNARMAAHLQRSNSALYSALKKYGLQSFYISVIDTAESWTVLCEKERYWIAFYSCISPNGYNLTAGGEGLFAPSPETLNKMRRPKGPSTPEHIAHLRHLAAGQKGLKRSPHIGEAIRASKLGKPRSPETIAKMRAAATGKKQGAETIARRAVKLKGNSWNKGKTPWNKGQITPSEVRLKQSEAKTKRCLNDETFRAAQVARMLKARQFRWPKMDGPVN